MYKLFKVEKRDMDQYLESIKPPKREKSPLDPYYHKLQYSPYHKRVQKTNQIFTKLCPHESRRHTDDQVIQDFLDQE